MEDTMTPGHRPWKKSILTGGALSAAWWPCPLFTWSNSISLALNLFILIWTTPPGLNVTSAIPPFICSVGPGNQFMLLDPDIFFVPSFVVGSFRYPYPSLCCLIWLIYFRVTWRWHLKWSVRIPRKAPRNLVTEGEAPIETRTLAYLKQKWYRHASMKSTE